MGTVPWRDNRWGCFFLRQDGKVCQGVTWECRRGAEQEAEQRGRALHSAYLCSHLLLIFSYESRLRSVNFSVTVSAAVTEKIYLSKPAGHRHEKIR